MAFLMWRSKLGSLSRIIPHQLSRRLLLNFKARALSVALHGSPRPSPWLPRLKFLRILPSIPPYVIFDFRFVMISRNPLRFYLLQSRRQGVHNVFKNNASIKKKKKSQCSKDAFRGQDSGNWPESSVGARSVEVWPSYCGDRSWGPLRGIFPH